MTIKELINSFENQNINGWIDITKDHDLLILTENKYNDEDFSTDVCIEVYLKKNDSNIFSLYLNYTDIVEEIIDDFYYDDIISIVNLKLREYKLNNFLK